jgi:hypothetical protein
VDEILEEEGGMDVSDDVAATNGGKMGREKA